MSRHRHVRNADFYEDDYEYDDLSHSVDEHEYGVSPATMAEYMYDRNKEQALYAWTKETTIEEEPEEGEGDEHIHGSNSTSSLMGNLSDLERAQVNSCLEEVRNVVGETIPEAVLQEICIDCGFNLERTLDHILSMQDAPKPQRQRKDRGNRSKAGSGGQVLAAGGGAGAPSGAPEPAVTFSLQPDPSPAQPNGDISSGGRLDFLSNAKTTEDGPSAQVKTQRTAVDGQPPSQVKTQTKPPVVVAAGNDAEGSPKPGKKGKVGARKDDKRVPPRNASFTDLPHEVQVMTEGMHRNVTVSDFRVVDGTTPSKTSKKQLTAEEIQKEFQKRKAGGKDNINLVVVGHVDAGKSTLMGHLLYQLGEVNQRTMHKFEQETKKMGKASFAYAWVLDETEEERSRGVTMDIAQTRFETKSKVVTLLDAPGHKDFIPNMITGAAQADVAVLVANATRGEFETGFDQGGQTREHAMLIRSLGVAQLVVAVNKMDTVGWSQERYNEITKKLGQFLKQTGFRESSFVPCSGLEGDNLTKPATKSQASWYQGPTLLEKIDQFEPNERCLDKPLRSCITDVFKSMGTGFSVAGTLHSGVMQAGDKVLVMPQAVSASVKSILIDEAPVNLAFAGDNTVISLTGINTTDISIGSILCDPSNPIQAATRIRARIVVFNIEIPITKGFPVVFHYQSLSVSAVFKRLISQINKSTGEVIKQKPRCLVKHTSAIVDLGFDSGVCVELYKDFKDLGRFMLRSAGATIAAGTVTEILNSKGDRAD